MGAWIAQAGAEGYWSQEGNMGGSGLQQYAEKPCNNRCGFDSGRLLSVKEEEEEESRRRMVELMMGPCKYLYNDAQQRLNEEQPARLPTLDLLNVSPSPLYNSSSAHISSMDSTPIELEPDSPLPSGWEKCLDLKTGSIYFLNRSVGLSSSVDPRKASMYYGKSGIGADLNSWPASPTTSEVTMEASLKINAKQVSLNMNEKCGGDEGALDLNLSLHVGRSPSKFPSQNLSVVANAFSSVHPTQFKSPSTVPSASSSSSSITSSPINSSFPFPLSIMSSKEPRPCSSQDFDSTISKQDTRNFSWLAPKESRCTSSDHPLSEQSSRSSDAHGVSERSGQGSSIAPMVTVACANCLMFVMLSRSDPKCPRCGTCPDHLDFPQPPLKRAKHGFSL